MTDTVSGAPSVRELLRQYVTVLEELRNRGVLRGSGSPAGDYAELLFSKAFQWQIQRSSVAGFDAVDAAGIRYQVKAKRLTRPNRSRQLSDFKDLDSKPFDQLAAVLFGEEFGVQRAALIPIEVVVREATLVPEAHAWKFSLQDSVWEIPEVHDVSEALRSAEKELG